MTVAVSLISPSTEQVQKLNIHLERMRDLAQKSVTNPVTIDTFDWSNITTVSGGTGSTTSLPSLTGSVLGNGGLYTNTIGANTIGSYSQPGQINVKSNGTLDIKGKDADLKINGKSMTAWMEKVEERLNILTPNPELEKEWDDLRRLGERYRKLEKKCQEKTQMWEALKKLPKVKV